MCLGELPAIGGRCGVDCVDGIAEECFAAMP
jgi:hypothetical protein